ncbi:MAG TPA: DNA replication/repair protein RecF [Alphaproteobacteria bacterium]|nr:DNA replication/repair protein RecF [Alphaproteobacteria bacterium]
MSRPAAQSAAASVSRLTLTEFRCYAHARIEADPGIIVLTGPNGAGKTNLLEAISLLSPGRGLRGARSADFQRLNGPPEAIWGVAATIAGPDGDTLAGTGRELGSERRVVQIDGKAGKSQSALADILSIVWLTPQMDRLFTESAKGRRRFLDRLVFGLDPAHAGRVTRHDTALRQRAKLLAERPGETAWLDAVEAELAATGVALAAARVDMVGRLARALDASTGPFPRPVVTAEGPVEARLGVQPALAVEDWLKEALARNRMSDAAQGETRIGAHKGDLGVTHREKQVPAALTSTGEQKAILVAIVLAAARLAMAERGRTPILLLDEVAAHLDDTRRQALYAEISALGAQAWMTGTDRTLFDALGTKARHFTVRDAHITQA